MTRPRSDRRSRREVDTIVSRIRDMMVSGAWSRGASEKSLASEYNVSISMVRQWTIQASRASAASADADSVEEIRAATVSSLERLARKAEAWASAPDGDRRLIREAITAVVKAAEVAGVTVSAGHQTTVNVLALPDVSRLLALIDTTLAPFPDARAAVRAALTAGKERTEGA